MNAEEWRTWAELADRERAESPDGKTGFDRLIDRRSAVAEAARTAFWRIVGDNEELVIDLLRRYERAKALLPAEGRPPVPVMGTRTYVADVQRLKDWREEHGAYTYLMAARDYERATGIHSTPSFWGMARRHYIDRLGEL